jgi:hypothetical protein
MFVHGRRWSVRSVLIDSMIGEYEVLVAARC